MNDTTEDRTQPPGIAQTILGMCGFVVEHLTPVRFACIAGSYALVWLMAPYASVSLAVWYFAVVTTVHYLYLFGMFGPPGWARMIRRRFGESRGFLLHESWMAFIFCQTGLSIGFICAATRDLPLLALSVPPLSLAERLVAAGVLIVAGIGVKTWATMLVGMDSYYYRALFTERAGGTFQLTGPYRVFRDPMYTVGHLQAYGLALWYGSAWGLVACALNQALVLTFNVVVEQPATRRIFGTGDDEPMAGEPEVVEPQA